MYFEATQDVQVAISREKQIKGWLRAKKIALIESMNQEWADLSLDWLSESESGAVNREILRLRGTSAQNDIQGKHGG